MRDPIEIDAGTFQKQLASLAEVLAQKVRREAPKLLAAPQFVSVDLHVLIRQAMRTYDLFFYLNADERRENDFYWRPAYTVVTLPLIRNMMDCLYNITAILQDPSWNGAWFRKSGYGRILAALDSDQSRYGGEAEWDEWITKTRSQVDLDIRANGLTVAEVLAFKPSWPTLGTYVRNKRKGGTTTPHQDFLEQFTYGHWREYSAMAHGAFEGLLPVAMFYIADAMPREGREKLDEAHPRMLSMHIGRAAAILLCIITELQAYFHFDGADINRRIHEVWNALMPTFEVKELYDGHYAKLMNEKGINP